MVWCILLSVSREWWQIKDTEFAPENDALWHQLDTVGSPFNRPGLTQDVHQWETTCIMQRTYHSFTFTLSELVTDISHEDQYTNSLKVYDAGACKYWINSVLH